MTEEQLELPDPDDEVEKEPIAYQADDLDDELPEARTDEVTDSA